MTALTKSVARDGENYKLPNYKIAADVKIYRGAMVMTNADGLLVPCGVLAGSVFAGVSRTENDMTGEVAGSAEAQVEAIDAFEVDIAAAVQADIGKKVYALDDNSVGLTLVPDTVVAGKIVEIISATKVLVKPDADQAK